MKNNEKLNKGFSGILERMRRERERRWILKMLQERTLETGIKTGEIRRGGRHFHLKVNTNAKEGEEKGFRGCTS